MNWTNVINQAILYKGPIYGIDLNLRKTFNKVLKAEMEKHSITTSKLAKDLNRSYQTVNLWVKESTCPYLQTILEIKKYFEKLEHI